jgi:3-methyladenine DNA glycosylase/8-oxoguanine DNA glycosylase
VPAARAPRTSRYSETAGGLIADVVPAWPFRMPARGGPDGVSRVRDGVYERFLHVDARPVLVRAWERHRERSVRIAAIPVPVAWIEAAERMVAERRERGGIAPRRRRPGRRPVATETRARPPAGREQLETAIERARHALALDDDLGEFYETFRGDPLLGPQIKRMPWLRARRCAWPWEAFAWAVTEQLIEVERAQSIQRRILGRWGCAALPPDRGRVLRDVPDAGCFAERAPAELAALDLAPKRAIAMIKAAREVASGRADPGRSRDDRRLLAISEIGPWTVQVLGQKGRGDPDSLPAGDLAYVKLVGHLAGLGRRATVAEVDEFYAPYAPFRGLAGLFMLVGHSRAAAAAPPLRYHPPRPELEAA